MIDKEWGVPIAREHAAKAIARAREWDCTCSCCNQARDVGWRPDLDRHPYSMDQRVAGHIACDIAAAALRLWEMRGTQVARKALDVVTAAGFALATPTDPKRAAAVERMYQALTGADVRGSRLIMFEIERAVRAAQGWFYSVERDKAASRLRSDLAAIAERHDANAPLPEAGMLDRLLLSLDAGKIEMSGAVGRILATMGVGSAKGLSEVTLTKRVSEAFRARAVSEKKKGVAKQAKRPKSKKKRNSTADME